MADDQELSDDSELGESNSDSNVSDSEEESTTQNTTKGMRYVGRTIAQKAEILEYSRVHSINAAAKKFKVDRKCIRAWKRLDFDAVPNHDKRKRKSGSGKKRKFTELEDRLYEWIKSKRDAKLRVSRAMTYAQGKRMYAEQVSANADVPDGFKFSHGWFHRFMKRYKLSFRRRTTVCQKDPVELIPKMVGNMLFIRNLREQNNLSLSQIFGADETAVWLDASSATTIETTGAREVSVKTTGNDKARITVLLWAKANGTKCKPFVLIPRKRPMKELERFNKDLVFSFCGRNWMDDELTEEFLRKCFGPDLFGRKRLLVWDSFRSHYSEKTKAILKELKIDIAVIPGGTTKYMQPADVVWNAPFKAKIRASYDEWMSGSAVKPKTKGGNEKAPGLDLVCEWIVAAWKSLSSEVIQNSFLNCGITNALDGSQDQMITCFKEGHSCHAGLELLKQKSAEFRDAEMIEPVDYDAGSDSESEIEL